MCGSRSVEEFHLALLDAQLDPAIDQFPEGLVGREALFDGHDTVGADEAAHGCAVMDIGQLVVGPVTVRVLRAHTAAPETSADLILTGDAAGMHGANSE